MRRMMVGLAVVGSLCLTVAVASAGEGAPDGTVELKGGSVAAGVGVPLPQLKQYPITADGFDVGEVGITNITASAKVYYLQKRWTTSTGTISVLLLGPRLLAVEVP